MKLKVLHSYLLRFGNIDSKSSGDFIDNINGNLVERINIDKNDYLNRNLNSFKIDYNKYSSGVYIVNIGDNSKLISIIK